MISDDCYFIGCLWMFGAQQDFDGVCPPEPKGSSESILLMRVAVAC